MYLHREKIAIFIEKKKKKYFKIRLKCWLLNRIDFLSEVAFDFIRITVWYMFLNITSINWDFEFVEWQCFEIDKMLIYNDPRKRDIVPPLFDTWTWFPKLIKIKIKFELNDPS